jgi:hypothetical protein
MPVYAHLGHQMQLVLSKYRKTGTTLTTTHQLQELHVKDLFEFIVRNLASAPLIIGPVL